MGLISKGEEYRPEVSIYRRSAKFNSFHNPWVDIWLPSGVRFSFQIKFNHPKKKKRFLVFTFDYKNDCLIEECTGNSFPFLSGLVLSHINSLSLFLDRWCLCLCSTSWGFNIPLPLKKINILKLERTFIELIALSRDRCLKAIFFAFFVCSTDSYSLRK